MKTAIALDPRCVAHSMGARHPESPQRLEALIALLDSDAVGDLDLLRLGARLASEDEILRVHTGDYWRRIADTEGRTVRLDPDTTACPHSFEAARRAAGATIEAVESVERAQARNAFAIVRPPGHHAEPHTAMGFCLFNSIAVAAEHLRHGRGRERIAIVDFDVHHGNGTQRAFWSDPQTLYASTHQAPFYPGTGAGFEVGGRGAEGTTVNLPLRPGHGDSEYTAIYAALLPRILEQFEPDWLLVSAGFDVMAGDPLAAMGVTPSGIRAMADGLVGAAERLCDGRIAMLLEGGYDLGNLSAGTLACLGALQTPAADPPPSLDERALGGAAAHLDTLRAHYRV